MITIKDIRIDLPPQLLAALTEDILAGALADIAESARNHWIGLAGKELVTSRRTYIEGIQPTEYMKGMAIVTLLGSMPNAIENDMPETDLHDTFLGSNVPTVEPGERGKHAKKDGTGYYRYIPFRHATPASTGAVGNPMGRSYGKMMGTDNARALGEAVYKQAKKLKTTTGMPGGPMQWGGRLKAGLAPLLKPHHSVDIYASMYRMSKTYAKATQQHYMTFRTISTGSPGWIRPRTEGKHYAEKTADFVEKPTFRRLWGVSNATTIFVRRAEKRDRYVRKKSRFAGQRF
jgi:hypothetical protein